MLQDIEKTDLWSISLAMPKRILLIFCLCMIGILTACSPSTPSNNTSGVILAPLTDMPADVLAAPVVVQHAYQFAAANPELMTHIPCYCGCGSMGHTSNYACYVSGEDEHGNLQFDNHALGCSICVDITMDAMRLQQEGKSTTEIRAYVDQTYSQFGPSNIP